MANDPTAGSSDAVASSLFKAVRQFWWVIVAGVAVGGLLGLGFSATQSTKYTATAKVLLDSTNRAKVFADTSSNTTKLDPVRELQNEAERMKSPTVIDRAAQTLGDPYTSERVRKDIDVSPAPDQDLLSVTATEAKAGEAARAANAMVDSYEQIIVEARQADIANTNAQLTSYRDQQNQEIANYGNLLTQIHDETDAGVRATAGRFPVEADITAEVARELSANTDYQHLKQLQDADQSSVDTTNSQIAQLNIDSSLLNQGVDVAEDAITPTSPTQPKPARNVALGGALGLFLGLGIGWWRSEKLAPTDDRGVHAAFGAPLLGAMPARRGRGGETDLAPDSDLAAVGRMVTTALLHRLGPSGKGTVVVAGLSERDASTLVAVTVAVAAARPGRSTVLVDGDAAGRALTTMCDGADRPGYTDLVVGTEPLAELACAVPISPSHNLQAVPAGHDASMDSAGHSPVQALAELSRRYQLVLIDGPPLLTSSGAIEIAQVVDGVVLVVSPSAPSDDLARAKERLALVDATLLGVVTSPPSGRGSVQVKGMAPLRPAPFGELESPTNGAAPAPADGAESRAPSGGVVGSTPLGFVLRQSSDTRP